MLRQDRKEATRYDRKAERDNEADLDAYNAMLAGLGEGRDAAAEAYYRTEYRGDEVQGYVHSEKTKRDAKHGHRGESDVLLNTIDMMVMATPIIRTILIRSQITPVRTILLIGTMPEP